LILSNCSGRTATKDIAAYVVCEVANTTLDVASVGATAATV
jgi:hypothetical protein